MKNKVFIAIILMTTQTFAAKVDPIEEDRNLFLNQDKSQILDDKDAYKFPEIYQQSEALIRDTDSRTNIKGEPYYTRLDSSRFALSYTFSQDYEDPGKVVMFDTTYLNQFDNSYQNMWWGIQFKRTSADYSAIADARVNSTGSSDSVADLSRGDNEQILNQFGAGVAHRFKILSQVYDTDRLFEMITVFFNYTIHQDSTDDEQYTGFGYNAEYLFAYRSSKRFYYGTKLTYNWAQVLRTQQDEEDVIDRSLVFGWTTVGFELGYFF